MKKDDIIKGAEELRKNYPYYRKGQSVFNYVEETLGHVAREVQFLDHVDCFYDDSEIDEFIDYVIKRLKNNRQ